MRSDKFSDRYEEDGQCGLDTSFPSETYSFKPPTARISQGQTFD